MKWLIEQASCGHSHVQLVFICVFYSTSIGFIVVLFSLLDEFFFFGSCLTPLLTSLFLKPEKEIKTDSVQLMPLHYGYKQPSVGLLLMRANQSSSYVHGSRSMYAKGTHADQGRFLG